MLLSVRLWRRAGSRVATAVAVLAMGLAAACAPNRALSPAVRPSAARAPEPPCHGCTTLPLTADVTGAIVGRVADLKARGGDCETYGDVLESSLAAGRIILRPYMWREGPNLASALGRPTGEMLLAREIDSLNVGVRTLDDVVWSVEHEAAHIAFRIPSGDPANEASANEHVRACHGASAQHSAR